MNVNIYRSTISEMQPVDGNLIAMGVRDAIWLSCPIGRSIQDWAMYADVYQKEWGEKILKNDICGQHWANWGWALRGLLAFGGALVDFEVADTIISRVLDNEEII